MTGCISFISFVFIFLQVVHPAFQTMLAHLRCKALEKFKKDIEGSLNDGKRFAQAVRDCTRSSMFEFDRAFVGNNYVDHSHYEHHT